jgi:hypothetical protein
MVSNVLRIGFNPYVECDPKAHTKYAQSEGLRGLMKEYQQAEYPRPLMFGEFGCNLGDNTIDGFQAQRAFYDVRVCLLLSPMVCVEK